MSYITNIEETTKKNQDFRRVLYTGELSQLVVMSLRPGEDIGEEVHAVDQFIRFEEGSAKVILDGKETEVAAEDAVVITKGTRHNVVNSGPGDLKLYTVYSPPNHIDGTRHRTKKDAEADTADEKFGHSR